MSTAEPSSAPDEGRPSDDAAGQRSDNGQSDSDGRSDSVVAPPSYPAYSTPPPEGLHTAEDG